MKLKFNVLVVALSVLSACGGNSEDTTITDAADVDTAAADLNASVVDRDVDTTETNPVTEVAGTDTSTTVAETTIDNDTSTTEVTDADTPANEEEPVVVNPVDTNPPQSLLNEDRTRPVSGLFSSASLPVKSNGDELYPNDGNPPQRVDANRVASWPGLRYGNFLVSNNAWNASTATYPRWFQQIRLYDNGNTTGVWFDWDWGDEFDTNGSPFDTKSFPEVIYGSKSRSERSGTYSETGLPVEIHDAPTFNIDYSYRNKGRRSDSYNTSGTDFEFNVAIQSMYHSSCDIRREGSPTDNGVFEVMVWLKAGSRKPSGEAPRATVATSDGKLYDVYTRLAINPNFIAFVAQNEQTAGSVLYTELLNHAKDNALTYGIYPLKDTDCLANITIGTEIWHGAGSFSLSQYTINRSY